MNSSEIPGEGSARRTWESRLLATLVSAALIGCAASDTDAVEGNDSRGNDVGDAGDETGASRDGGTECRVTAPTSCNEPELMYADIEPLIEKHCVNCHYGERGGPWPLLTYQHVADWYDIIRGSLLNCTMPPPEDGLTMPIEERMKILEWLRCGYPE